MSEHEEAALATATETAARIRAGEITPTEAVEQRLERIDEQENEINAFTTVIEQKALDAAEEAEKELEEKDESELGALHGVPIALKDLGFAKEGVPLTSGLKLLADMGHTPGKTAAAVERLEDAGAIVIGMTNTPELGHKLVTDNEYIGATATPFNTDYNAGGSSGGSAAAVAAGMVPMATGSDMGGSIRLPAALCGVFGLKPSYGIVPADSRPSAFGGETHHITGGPITRSVEDAAVMMDVMAGQHPRDPTSVPVDIDFTGAVDQSVDDLRIAYTPDMDMFDVDEEVVSHVEEGIEALEDAGATVEEVTITDDIDVTHEELVEAMKTSGAKVFADGQEVFKQSMDVDLREYSDTVSDSMIKTLEFGSEKDSTDEAEVELIRTKFFDAVQDVFAEYDLLITPIMERKGLELHSDKGVDFEHFLTFPFSLTGHPASSVPVGLTEDEGLPVGMQIVGPRYSDGLVLTASAAVERQNPWAHFYED